MLFRYLLDPRATVVMRIGIRGWLTRRFGQLKMIMGLGIEKLLLTLILIQITKLGLEVNRQIRNQETPNRVIVGQRQLERCFSKPNYAANSEQGLARISQTAILHIVLKSFEDHLPIGKRSWRPMRRNEVYHRSQGRNSKFPHLGPLVLLGIVRGRIKGDIARSSIPRRAVHMVIIVLFFMMSSQKRERVWP
ncbi:hypothetical protein CsSME_00049789 [Camellia sinensis var. sinensis]